MVEELNFEQQDVTRCCKILAASSSGYYNWLKRPLSVKKTEDERLYQKIKIHWHNSRKSYGARRITAKLKNEGEHIARKRVGRLMNKNGIKAIGKKKFKPVTTNSNHNLPIADRIFKTEIASEQITRPNQYWGGDLT
jgi:transposase InsO family protein